MEKKECRSITSVSFLSVLSMKSALTPAAIILFLPSLLVRLQYTKNSSGVVFIRRMIYSPANVIARISKCITIGRSTTHTSICIRAACAEVSRKARNAVIASSPKISVRLSHSQTHGYFAFGILFCFSFVFLSYFFYHIFFVYKKYVEFQSKKKRPAFAGQRLTHIAKNNATASSKEINRSPTPISRI